MWCGPGDAGCGSSVCSLDCGYNKEGGGRDRDDKHMPYLVLERKKISGPRGHTSAGCGRTLPPRLSLDCHDPLLLLPKFKSCRRKNTN